MSKRKRYNPEKRAWKGKSYRKGRKKIREERDKDSQKHTKEET